MPENIQNKEMKPRVDGRLAVTLGDMGKDAYLTIYNPENGGRAVTVADVNAELSKLGIRFGVDNEAIAKAVEAKDERNYCIAKCKMPENGIDGTIEYLFSREQVLNFKEDENGFVDYKDLGQIQNVVSGTVIANITLPTKGEPGVSVKRVEIPQVPGSPAPFVIGKNTALGPDGTTIVATCDGNIRWDSNKFVIDDVVTVSEVDSSVGNIDFIGSVVVKGDVLDGFKVCAKRSITINGNSCGATLEAGENLTIKLGSINSDITCHGDVNIGFCESSKIVCDGSLTSNAYVLCDIYCGGTLTATGSKGVVMGGKCVVLQNMVVNNLGADTFIPTLITVGDNAVLTAEKSENAEKVEKLTEQIQLADQMIEILKLKKKQLGSLPPEREELLVNTTRTKVQNQMEIGRLKRRNEEIDEYLEDRENHSIEVKRNVFPGVKVNINNCNHVFNNQYCKCRICLDENGMLQIVT